MIFQVSSSVKLTQAKLKRVDLAPSDGRKQVHDCQLSNSYLLH